MLWTINPTSPGFEALDPMRGSIMVSTYDSYGILFRPNKAMHEVLYLSHAITLPQVAESILVVACEASHVARTYEASTTNAKLLRIGQWMMDFPRPPIMLL